METTEPTTNDDRIEAARALYEADYRDGLRWDQGVGDYLIEGGEWLTAAEAGDDDAIYQREISTGTGNDPETVYYISGDVISERLNEMWDDEARAYWLDRL